MADKIRVGVIGAKATRGADTKAHPPWARLAHMPAIKALPQYDLRAVATTNQASADESARYFEAPLAFGDARQLIDHPEIDLVVVTVRAPYHYDLVRHAIEAGKHIYCEWPLALTAEEARDLAARAERKGIRHMIGLQARASPTFNYVKDLIAEGYVGRVLSANLNAAVPTWGEVIEAPLAYLADKTKGATLLTIHGGHALDGICHMLGDFDSVTATIANQHPTIRIAETGETIDKSAEDQVVISGVLETGPVVACHFQGGAANLIGSTLQIRGTDGDLEITTRGIINAAPLVLRGARADRDPSVAVEFNKPKDLEVLPIPAQYRHVPLELGERPSLNVGELYVRLADAIREGKDCAPGFALAAARQALLETIAEAAETGRCQNAPRAP